MGAVRRFKPDPARGLGYCRICQKFASLNGERLCWVCRRPLAEQAEIWSNYSRPEQEPEKETVGNG